MTSPDSGPRGRATEPVFDQNGVDRTLIRRMLKLTPVQRLVYVQDLVEEMMEIWQLNGTRPLR